MPGKGELVQFSFLLLSLFLSILEGCTSKCAYTYILQNSCINISASEYVHQIFTPCSGSHYYFLINQYNKWIRLTRRWPLIWAKSAEPRLQWKATLASSWNWAFQFNCILYIYAVTSCLQHPHSWGVVLNIGDVTQIILHTKRLIHFATWTAPNPGRQINLEGNVIKKSFKSCNSFYLTGTKLLGESRP